MPEDISGQEIYVGDRIAIAVFEYGRKPTLRISEVFPPGKATRTRREDGSLRYKAADGRLWRLTDTETRVLKL